METAPVFVGRVRVGADAAGSVTIEKRITSNYNVYIRGTYVNRQLTVCGKPLLLLWPTDRHNG